METVSPRLQTRLQGFYCWLDLTTKMAMAQTFVNIRLSSELWRPVTVLYRSQNSGSSLSRRKQSE